MKNKKNDSLNIKRYLFSLQKKLAHKKKAAGSHIQPLFFIK
jgi:hypothetical protein